MTMYVRSHHSLLNYFKPNFDFTDWRPISKMCFIERHFPRLIKSDFYDKFDFSRTTSKAKPLLKARPLKRPNRKTRTKMSPKESRNKARTRSSLNKETTNRIKCRTNTRGVHSRKRKATKRTEVKANVQRIATKVSLARLQAN